MTNIKQFPKKENLPDNCKNTEIYYMQEILYSEDQTKGVVDFTTGDERNRRWGVVISFSIFPKFEQVPVNGAPLLLPKTPARFVAADTIEEAKARINHELDKAFEMADLSVRDPEAFKKKAMEQLGKVGQINASDMS